ncbi:MAG: hypothetical protein ACJAUP_001124 [Cellvibrionaceae bacterium]|jgi:uncharacterized protein (DUF934 family)
MPTQNKMIKDGAVVNDTWLLISTIKDSLQTVPEGQTIVPLELWRSQSELKARSDIGVWLNNDSDLSLVAEELITLPIIAINFPIFMDGRGFSLARLLRERYGYQGEIRAIGHIIRDQLCYLKRCGFNAFTFDESVDINSAVASLNDFTEAYQTSVDMPQPLFKRKVI